MTPCSSTGPGAWHPLAPSWMPFGGSASGRRLRSTRKLVFCVSGYSWFDCGYKCMRQSTEPLFSISHISYVRLQRSIVPALFALEIWFISVSLGNLQPLVRCLCRPRNSGKFGFSGRRLHELFLYLCRVGSTVDTVHTSVHTGFPGYFHTFLCELDLGSWCFWHVHTFST